MFDDKTRQPDIMFDLVHYLESYPVDTQLSAMLSVLPQMVERAPWWTKVLHYRILNDAVAAETYAEMLNRASGDQRMAAERLVRAIVGESHPVSARAAALLSSASLNSDR